jgi:hypothetical protein
MLRPHALNSREVGRPLDPLSGRPRVPLSGRASARITRGLCLAVEAVDLTERCFVLLVAGFFRFIWNPLVVDF